MCVVVNIRQEKCDVYIGRARSGQYNKWGNKAKAGTREENIAAYRKQLWEQIDTGEISISELRELRGKKLGCFCKPKACHGDIIKKAVNWAWKQ